MPLLEMVTLTNRDTQTADTAVYRRDLPKSGYYSAVDVGVRWQNGATSSRGLEPLLPVRKLSLVCNGNDYKFHLSAMEWFRYWWLKNKKPLPYNFTEITSAYNEIWFRMQFGRTLGDKQYGLDLSKFDSVQVQIDYDLPGQWGAAAATTFTTATFAPTIIAHQFPIESRPAFRGFFGMREFYAATTVASQTKSYPLPSARPVLALGVMAAEDNIAEGTDVTDIKIGKDNFSKVWFNGKWYNFQAEMNYDLEEQTEINDVFMTAAETRDVHMANLKSAIVYPRVHTVPT